MGEREMETERKFERIDGADTTTGGLPDLTGIPDVAAVRGSGRITLNALYFDTPDLRLAARGCTLRRRTGGDDPGWHLKLPAGGSTRAVHLEPLTRRVLDIPEPLRELAREVTGAPDAPLVPVLRMRTARSPRRIVDANGRVLAEIDRDRVTTHLIDVARSAGGAEDAPLGTGTPGAAWTEVEVELVDGEPELLDAVEDCFAKAGLRRSDAASKLARALGERMPSGRAPAKPKKAKSAPKAVPAPVAVPAPAAVPVPGTVGAAVAGYLREQVRALRKTEPAVRRDKPDSVHRMRVALRRTRSAFRSHQRVLAPSVTAPLGEELRWLAGVLGRDRDQEVLTAHLLTLLDAQPEELIIGPVREAVVAWSRQEHQEARDEILRTFDDHRCVQLLAGLAELAADPPFRKSAAEPDAEALAEVLLRDLDRVDRRVRQAERATVAGDEAWHAARKAAKRARYSAEAATSVLGRPAGRLVDLLKDVQEVLGGHQDSVVTRTVLRELSVRAQKAGENSFTYGLLHEAERQRGETIGARLSEVWDGSRVAEARARVLAAPSKQRSRGAKQKKPKKLARTVITPAPSAR